MKLVALGDSNTGNNLNPYYVTESQTYFKLIADALGYVQAINAGVSGNKSGQMLARVQSDVIAHAPDVCLVMAGTNDAAASITNGTATDTLVADYITNMAGIIAALNAANIKPVIFSPPFSLAPRLEGRLQRMTDALRQLCASSGVAFVDLFGKMRADSDTMPASAFNQWFLDVAGSPDLYHLGATGHQRIADLFLLSQLQFVAQAPATQEGTALSVTLTGSFGNMDAKTVRTRIKPAAMTLPSGAVTKIRLTLQGHADEPLTLAKCCIGKRNAVGDPCDAVSLASLQVAGASAFTVPAGGQVVTDWLPFMWNKTDDLIVSFYSNGGASSDKLASASGTAAGDTYLKNGDEAAIADVTGFSEYLGYLSLVTKVETDGF